MIFAGGLHDFEVNAKKAEQREKEKRHRERLKSLELQRDKLHKAACEEAAAKFLELAAQNAPTKPPAPKHRHSVHASTANHLHITAEEFEKLKIHAHEGSKCKHSHGPQRSTSSDQCKALDTKKEQNTNKFLKWLGLAGKEQDKPDFKEMKKRRMSTFT